MKYKITALSMWQRPQIFHAETEEEMKEIRHELRENQFKVEVEDLSS